MPPPTLDSAVTPYYCSRSHHPFLIHRIILGIVQSVPHASSVCYNLAEFGSTRQQRKGVRLYRAPVIEKAEKFKATMGHTCFILECAIKNKVDHCTRCDQFPREVHYQQGGPFSQQPLDMLKGIL